MAGHAISLFVDPVQRKAGGLVIKIHHSVLPIMAEQARRAMALDMLAHELRILARMAVQAVRIRDGKASSFSVAGLTQDWPHVVVHLVFQQAERGLFVLELWVGAARGIEISAAMIWMAKRALVCIFDEPMRAFTLGDLPGRGCVARQA